MRRKICSLLELECFVKNKFIFAHFRTYYLKDSQVLVQQEQSLTKWEDDGYV